MDGLIIVRFSGGIVTELQTIQGDAKWAWGKMREQCVI